METAFAEDGSSSEGVAYWHYGLFNLVALSELLYACSAGQIDLLAGEKLKLIAAFPAKMQLSGANFASFADCDEYVGFHPGIITRLALRTGELTLLNLLTQPEDPDNNWRLPMMLRDILWWDGSQPASVPPEDTRLPAGGTARLVCLEHLEEQSQANHKTQVLKRLTIALPEGLEADVYVRMQLCCKEKLIC